MTQKLISSLEEAFEELDLGRTKGYAEIKAGRLKTVKIGRLRKVTAAQKLDYVRLLESEALVASGAAA